MLTDISQHRPRLVVFDLDSTITASKEVVEPEMVDLLFELHQHYHIAVISGASLDRILLQLKPFVTRPEVNLNNLLLVAHSGGSLFTYDSVAENWQAQIETPLTPEQTSEIQQKLKQVLSEMPEMVPAEKYGERVEARDGQVTYSALGQQAPLEKKLAWDPDRSKRTKMQKRLQELLPQFEIGIGGTTSVDITLPGINKAAGIGLLANQLKIPETEIIFVGDAVEGRGNDSAVLATQAICIDVDSVAQTKQIILQLISNATIQSV